MFSAHRRRRPQGPCALIVEEPRAHRWRRRRTVRHPREACFLRDRDGDSVRVPAQREDEHDAEALGARRLASTNWRKRVHRDDMESHWTTIYNNSVRLTKHGLNGLARKQRK